jgi:cellulose synthase/poly-beta-1,6-N-acetylglucosamine synthase-like glycosyltransferase
MKTKLTIAVTAFREEKTIGKCIESIVDQKIPVNYELLISCPDEPTANVVRKYQKKYKNIKLIRDPGKGKPFALNMIFKYAKGKILILTDGDVQLEKNSIILLLTHFKNPKVGGVSGKVIYQLSKSSLFYEWAKLSEKLFDKLRKKEAEEGKLWHPTGYLYAIRKGIINRIPVNSLSDDAVIGYLIYSKGYKIEYESQAKVYVKFPNKISDFIKQKARTRAGILQLNKWFKFKGRTISKEISLGIKDLFKIYGFKKFHKMIFLCLIYLITWFKAYWYIYTKKSFKKVWQRIETTK